MKWGIMAIITIGLIIAGVYGAMMAHGEGAEVTTSGYIINGKDVVSSVAPGETVKIAVEIKNTGNYAFALSGHTPVYAYADIYQYQGEELKKIQSVKFEPRYVTWHVMYLAPGKEYTAYIDWTVPENVTGMLHIHAWAGNAPETDFTVKVTTPQAQNQYDNSGVMVYADALVYYPGNVIHITVINMGNKPAMFGSGFEIVNGAGDKVAEKAWRNNIVLNPGESVEYTWTVPDNTDPGWYYIYSFANGDYETVYIY